MSFFSLQLPLILFYAVPLKKDLYVCIIHLALPQYWYPTPFPFEKMYIRLSFNWHHNLIWAIAVSFLQGHRGGDKDLVRGVRTSLATVSYIYLPWELTYSLTYHPVFNILKLFVLILSNLLSLQLTIL